jgi:hypothetical protein
MKKLVNWLLDKWLAGFITALIFFLLKTYIDLPTEKKANFFQFSWLKSILKTDVELWIVLLVVGFLLIMFARKKNVKGKVKSFTPRSLKPDYISDSFGQDNAKWVWDLEYDATNGKQTITNLKPVCPVCNTAMEIDTFTERTAVCYKCRLEGKMHIFEVKQLARDVGQEIVRRYNSGEWEKINKSN